MSRKMAICAMWKCRRARKAILYTVMAYLLLGVSFTLATAMTVLSTQSDRDIVQYISNQRMIDLVENLNYEGSKILFANVSLSNSTFQRDWLFSSTYLSTRPSTAASVTSFLSSAANSSGYSYSSNFAPLNNSVSETFFLKPSNVEIVSNYSSMVLVVNNSGDNITGYYIEFPSPGAFSYSWYSSPSGPIPYTIVLSSTNLTGTMGSGTHKLRVNSSSDIFNITFMGSSVRVDYFQGQRTVLKLYFNSSQQLLFSPRASNDNLIWADLVFFNMSSADANFAKRLGLG